MFMPAFQIMGKRVFLFPGWMLCRVLFDFFSWYGVCNIIVFLIQGLGQGGENFFSFHNIEYAYIITGRNYDWKIKNSLISSCTQCIWRISGQKGRCQRRSGSSIERCRSTFQNLIVPIVLSSDSRIWFYTVKSRGSALTCCIRSIRTESSQKYQPRESCLGEPGQ